MGYFRELGEIEYRMEVYIFLRRRKSSAFSKQTKDYNIKNFNKKRNTKNWLNKACFVREGESPGTTNGHKIDI